MLPRRHLFPQAAAGARTLYISDLNGYEADDKTTPESFEDQSEYPLTCAERGFAPCDPGSGRSKPSARQAS